MNICKAFSAILLVLTVTLVFSGCTKPPEEDYNLYEDMRVYPPGQTQRNGGHCRARGHCRCTIDHYYVLDLSLIPRLVFGSKQLEVHMYSYESDAMAVASISQFEVPA